MATFEGKVIAITGEQFSQTLETELSNPLDIRLAQNVKGNLERASLT